MVLHSKGGLLALPTNIRLGRHQRAATNTLAYNTAILCTVKNIFEQDIFVNLILKLLSQFTYSFASQAILENREIF
jgi:hypothetical protein